MGKNNTHEVTKLSILIALTVIMTMVVSIPIVGGNGYVNLGDMVIFLAALMLGKKSAFLVGGLGSFLADLLLGFGIYAPASLIIKGLEGLIAGYLLEKKLGRNYPILATIVAGLWMAFGYYIFEIFLYGSKGALASVPVNLAQGVLGAITSIILYTALKKTKLFEV